MSKLLDFLEKYFYPTSIVILILVTIIFFLKLSLFITKCLLIIPLILWIFQMVVVFRKARKT